MPTFKYPPPNLKLGDVFFAAWGPRWKTIAAEKLGVTTTFIHNVAIGKKRMPWRMLGQVEKYVRAAPAAIDEWAAAEKARIDEQARERKLYASGAITTLKLAQIEYSKYREALRIWRRRQPLEPPFGPSPVTPARLPETPPAAEMTLKRAFARCGLTPGGLATFLILERRAAREASRLQGDSTV